MDHNFIEVDWSCYDSIRLDQRRSHTEFDKISYTYLKSMNHQSPLTENQRLSLRALDRWDISYSSGQRVTSTESTMTLWNSGSICLLQMRCLRYNALVDKVSLDALNSNNKESTAMRIYPIAPYLISYGNRTNGSSSW